MGAVGGKKGTGGSVSTKIQLRAQDGLHASLQGRDFRQQKVKVIWMLSPWIYDKCFKTMLNLIQTIYNIYTYHNVVATYIFIYDLCICAN